MNKEKIGKLNISINSLQTVPNDPTIVKCKMIICDFEVSGNRQCITEEVANDNLQTLIGKRICCKYIKAEDNDGIDALSDHEEEVCKDRNGNDVVYYNTDAIGYIENAYIDTYIDKNGNSKRVIFADAILWYDDHYKDIIDLLNEWLNNGISIKMSCEYLYYNFSVKDGVEYIQSPIVFVAHTLLNSEDRGNMLAVEPSYECAELLSINEKKAYNKAVNKLIKSKNNKEEYNTMENKFLNAMKSNNQKSFGDIRDGLMSALAKVMTAEEYFDVWISLYNVYEDCFVYETYEDSKYVYYKVSYTKDENGVVTEVGFANKEKVERSDEFVSVNKLNEANETIKNLNAKIVDLNGELEKKSTNEKNNIDKFNELSDKVVSLNAQVKEMKPIVDKYNEDKFEKSFNAAKSLYENKFKAVNALNIFNEDDTQNLIKESVNSDETISSKAKYSLNALIVDNINPVQTNDDEVVLGESHVSVNQIQEITDDNDGLIGQDTDTVLKDEYGINY